MIHPALEVRASPIHGMGLFTKELIKKGTIVWQKDESVITLDLDLLQFLPSSLEQYLNYFGFAHGNEFHMPRDISLFTNHYENPNLKHCKSYEITNRDIFPNEELTLNYREWEKEDEIF